jgi:hypothetical protein
MSLDVFPTLAMLHGPAGAFFVDVANSTMAFDRVTFQNSTADGGAGGAVFTTDSSRTNVDGLPGNISLPLAHAEGNSAINGAYGPGFASYASVLAYGSPIFVATPTGDVPSLIVSLSDSYKSVALSYGAKSDIVMRATIRAPLQSRAAVPADSGTQQDVQFMTVPEKDTESTSKSDVAQLTRQVLDGQIIVPIVNGTSSFESLKVGAIMLPSVSHTSVCGS